MITIATYNVENLFDLKKSGFEYDEYIPNGVSEWNQKNYDIKLKNISKVISGQRKHAGGYMWKKI